MAEIYNDKSNTLLSGSSGNDSIRNYGDSVKIYAGNGNDTVWSTDGSRSYVTIDGGSGSNLLELWGKKSQIIGGKDKDTIFIHGKNVTINSGAGNDRIENWDDNVGRSDDGDGKAKIISGSGNDSILNLGSGATINTGTGNDTITFRSHYRDGIIYDSKRNVIQYTNGDGNDIIYGFNPTSTLSIGGGSYSIKKSGDDVIVTVGKGKISLMGAASLDKVNIKGTKTSSSSKNTSIHSDAFEYNGHSYYIYSNVAKTWDEAKSYCEARGGHLAVINDEDENTALFDYIKRSGYNSAYFGLSDAAKEGTWIWVNGDSSTYRNWASGEPNSENSKEDYAMFFYIFSDGKWNDGSFNADLTEFICEWETVSGDSESKLITLTKNDDTYSNTIEGATILALGGNDTLKNSASNVIISAGKGDDSIYSTESNSSIDGGAGNDIIHNEVFGIVAAGSNNTVSAGVGEDFISSDGLNALIFAGDDNDTILNYGTYAKIYAGAGNDSIVNQSSVQDYNSKVTISGGTGNDYIKNDNGSNILFNYTAGDGNDVIYGFNSTSTLSIGGGSYLTKKIGDNIIVTVGKGKISLMGAASLDKVNIKGTKATSTTKTVTDKTKSPVTVGSAIKTINASSRTKAVEITGNSLSNTIQGGSGKDILYGKAGNDSILGNAGADKLYGGAGNDTLTGGKGNDSLWGGSGADKFIYASGDGKDVIYSFGDNDMLKITGKFSATYDDSEDEIYFKVGSTANAITLSDFSATTFNVNGTKYKISGSTLKKQ